MWALAVAALACLLLLTLLACVALACRWRRNPHVLDSRAVHPAAYGDEKVANREIRVWHGAIETGP
jgi:hypothetical protein